MTIRTATPEDKPHIEDLARDAYQAYVPRIGREPAPMRDDYGALISAGQVFVAEEGGQILGVLVLKDEPGTLLLDNVAVRPEAQGRGCGGSLIRFAEAEARRRGFSSIRLYTNEAMIENILYYGRLGFAETHRDEEKGFKRVYMRKCL